MTYYEELVLAPRLRAGQNPSHRVLTVESYLGCDYCHTESTTRERDRVRHPCCDLCILQVRGYQAMIYRKQVSNIDRWILTRFALDEGVFALYNSNGHTNTLEAGDYPDGYAATIGHDVIRATYAENPKVVQALIDFTQDNVLRTQLTKQFCVQPLPSYFILSNVFYYMSRYHYPGFKTFTTQDLSVMQWKDILKALFCKFFDLRQPWSLMQLCAPGDTPRRHRGFEPTEAMRNVCSVVDAAPNRGLYSVVIHAKEGRNNRQPSELEERYNIGR